MLTLAQDNRARHSALDAIEGVGIRLTHTDPAPAALSAAQAKRWRARNVMTPVRFAVLRLRVGVWVEISLGNFLDKPIYGVTLFDTVDPSRDYTHSTCCHSPDELRTVLLALKGD